MHHISKYLTKYAPTAQAGNYVLGKCPQLGTPVALNMDNPKEPLCMHGNEEAGETDQDVINYLHL